MTLATGSTIDHVDGEIAAEGPQSFAEALAQISELDILLGRANGRVQGLDLQLATLKKDREAEALARPERPLTELIHAVHKKATGKRRPLDFTDREKIGNAVQKLGLYTCLKAVAGAVYDPYIATLRNGKRQPKNDLELVFRGYGKVKDFAERAPLDWKPKPEQIAEIAEVDVEWVREQLRGAK